VGVGYNQQLTATGGTPTYAWKLAADSPALPAGLTLSGSGLISGTPTTAGTSTVKFQVTDAGNNLATGSLLITVDASSIVPLNVWTNIYAAEPKNTSATNLLAGNFAVGSGANRLLLVAIVMEIGTGANPTISASYGGVQLSQLKVTNSTQREIVWLGYLKESQIGSGTKNLTITYGGAVGKASALHVKWAAFGGVNQADPFVSSAARNTNTTSATFGTDVAYVAKGITTVVAGNGGTPVTGTLTATPSFTPGTAITASAQTSNTYTSATHATSGTYSSSTSVVWSGTPASSWSGLVAVSLRP
jgi:hypothetical protein